MTGFTPADPVLAAIRRNVLAVLPDLDPVLVDEPRTLAELGCNSVDRADVVAMTMYELGVTIPVNEFGGVQDIGGLARLLRRYAP